MPNGVREQQGRQGRQGRQRRGGPNQRRCARLFCALLLLMPGCDTAVPQADEQPTALRRAQPVAMTHRTGDLVATLTWREVPGALTLAVQRDAGGVSVGEVPMSARVTAWQPLLQQFFTQHKRLPSYRLTVGPYPELQARVAHAAACTGRWEKGAPIAAEQTRALFGDTSLYPELTALLGAFHYELSVESAESVMLCDWGRVRPTGATCGRALDPSTQVPCGASIVFRLTTTR